MGIRAAAVMTLLLSILTACQTTATKSGNPAATTIDPLAPRHAQVATRPGRYIVGEDLDPGHWFGMARVSSCTYTTVLGDFGSVPRIGKLTAVGSTPDAGDQPASPWTYFWIRAGDVLELWPDKPSPIPNHCEFWNDGSSTAPPTPALPAASDVPWRDVDRTADGVDRWKMGQFDYLAAAKERVGNLNETQLSLMGYLACQVGYRDVIANTFEHFARLTAIQADFLVTMSYKFMCPSEQHI